MNQETNQETKSPGNDKKLSIILGTIAVVLLAAFIITQVNLKSQIGKLTGENAALAAEGAGKDETIAALEADKASLADRISTLESDFSSLEEKSAGLESEKADLTTQLTDISNIKTSLSDKVDELNTLSDTLTEEKAALADRITTLEADNSALGEKVTGLESDKADLTAQVTELTDSNTSLSDKITELDALAASLSDAKAALTEQISDLESKAAALEEKAAGLESEKAELTDANSAFAAQTEELTDSNTALSAQISELSGLKTALEEKVSALEADKSSLTEQISGLEAEKLDLSEKISGMEAEKFDLSEKVSGLEDDKVILSGQIGMMNTDSEALSAQVTELTGANEALSAQVSELTDKLTGLEEELKSSSEIIESMGEEKAALNEKISTLEADKAALTEKIDELTTNLTSDEEESASDPTVIRLSGEDAPESAEQLDVIKISLGFPESDDGLAGLFEGSDILIKTDPNNQVMDMSVKAMGINFLDLLLNWDEEGLGFYLPLLDQNYYRLGWELLEPIFGDKTPDLKNPANISLDSQKYVEIFTKYFSFEDFSMSEETVEIVLFNENADCTVLRFSPTDEQLKGFLTELLTELNRDEQIDQLLELEYKFSSEAAASGDPDGYAREKISVFHEGLENSLENMDQLVEKISGMELSLATEGERIREILLDNFYGMGFLYESSGEPEEARGDAVYIYQFENSSSILMLNQYQNALGVVNGYFDVVADDDLLLEAGYNFDSEVKSELSVPYGSYILTLGDDSPFRLDVFETENGSMHQFDFNDFKLLVESAKDDGSLEKPNLTPIEVRTQEDLNSMLDSLAGTAGEFMEMLGL